jgi:hypothetical protein
MYRINESLVDFKETEGRLRELYVWTRRDVWTWRAAGALAGLGGGILAAAVGALLSAVAWALGDEGGELSLRGVGSMLLLSTIPLLILGAHCLYLSDGKMERSRRPLAVREGEASVSVKRARTGVAAAVVILLTLLCGTHSKTRVARQPLPSA